MHKSSHKAEKFQVPAIGKGIPSLLREAYEILGNPILIHNMEYQAVAFTPDAISDDPIWIEYATKGTVGPDWLGFFRDECFLEAAANAKNVTFLTSDKLPYNRMYGKLVNKNNIQIGCAVLTACDKPFDQDDPVVFEQTCAALSAELSKDDFFNEYGQVYFEKLIDELIAGISDIAMYAAHVESIYMHLEANLHLAIVDIEKCNPTYQELAYFRDLFKKTQPEFTYAVYKSYVLILIGSHNNAFYVEKDLSQLNQLFHKSNLYAGISSSFENLFELPKYYQEALFALQNGVKSSEQRVFLYDHFRDNMEA